MTASGDGPHHPPPAPDWVLGDDGHWKPPPFSLDTSLPPTPPRPGPAAMAAPPVVATPAHGGGVGGPLAMILVGLGVVAVLVVVGIGGVLLLGTSSDPSREGGGAADGRDVGDDRAIEPDRSDGHFVPIPMDDEAAPTTASPELAGTTCPTVEAVASVVEEAAGVTPPEPRATQIDLNEVVFDAVVCDYGATTGIARLASESPETDLARLRASLGRFDVRRDGDDVWVTLPDHDGRGSVRLVFIHEGELWSVARNGSDGTQVRQLADLVIAG